MYKIKTIDLMMSFECGELDDKNTLKLFSNLIESKQAWSLQGFYGRTAQSLLDNNYIIKKSKQYRINTNKLN